MKLVHAITLVALTLLATTATAQVTPQQSVLFTNVMVFDGTSEALRDVDVLVTGNTISQISEEPLAVIASTNMTVIDGAGRTLMPGLISSHVHLTHTLVDGGIPGWNAMTWEDLGAVATASAKEYLMMGFTTVRDMGGMADGFKRAIDKGLIEGPRIYPAGAYIAQTSGHGDLRMRGQPNAQLTGIQYSNLERLGARWRRDIIREGSPAYDSIHHGGVKSRGRGHSKLGYLFHRSCLHDANSKSRTGCRSTSHRPRSDGR